MPVAEAAAIFDRLDVLKDGAVSLPEFTSGFHDREDMETDGAEVSGAWEHFERRLGEQAKFIPRSDSSTQNKYTGRSTLKNDWLRVKAVFVTKNARQGHTTGKK